MESGGSDGSVTSAVRKLDIKCKSIMLPVLTFVAGIAFCIFPVECSRDCCGALSRPLQLQVIHCGPQTVPQLC